MRRMQAQADGARDQRERKGIFGWMSHGNTPLSGFEFRRISTQPAPRERFNSRDTGVTAMEAAERHASESALTLWILMNSPGRCGGDWARRISCFIHPAFMSDKNYL
jgi:hypothetical protein